MFVDCLQAKDGSESQVDVITQENAILKASNKVKQAELNSVLLRISAVHHCSAELQSQLVKQSADLNTLQRDLTETTLAKDKALEVSFPFCRLSDSDMSLLSALRPVPDPGILKQRFKETVDAKNRALEVSLLFSVQSALKHDPASQFGTALAEEPWGDESALLASI